MSLINHEELKKQLASGEITSLDDITAEFKNILKEVIQTMKYWVFGHTHDAIEYEMEDVKFLCNPFGYPNESEYGANIKMKSFEI